jgi:hypothetical protein
MMSDKEFAELELRATICPGQCEWPKPEYVHWQKLHEAANEARARVSKAYTQMDEIDRNADLSREEKQHQRCEVAAHALAGFDASKTLLRAREAVVVGVAVGTDQSDHLDALAAHLFHYVAEDRERGDGLDLVGGLGTAAGA